jgi:hypothetical protein
VKFGDEFVFFELHDLHEHLAYSVVDLHIYKADLKESYELVFGHRNDIGIFGNLVFQLPDDVTTTLTVYDTNSFGSVSFDIDEGISGRLSGHFALDFDSRTVLSAIEEMNKHFGVTTFVDKYGHLIVGTFDKENSYTANQEGTKDWHIIDPNLANPYSRVNRVVVNGPKVGSGFLEDRAEEIWEWLDWTVDNDVGVRMQAIAENTKVEDGVTKEFTYREIDRAKPYQLVEIAERKLVQIEQQQYAGSVEIGSSTSENPPTDVQIGDTVTIDEPPECDLLARPSYKGGEYVVTGINQDNSNGWITDVHLLRLPEIELRTNLRFIDLKTGEEYTYDDIYGYRPGIFGSIAPE